MENWEFGTRNRSGTKVRTFTGDEPALRMSCPNDGYVPFQYARSFGGKSGTGLRYVGECTPAKVAHESPVSGRSGRRLPDEIEKAVAIASVSPTSNRGIKRYMHATQTILDFLKAESNTNASAALKRYESIVLHAERKREAACKQLAIVSGDCVPLGTSKYQRDMQIILAAKECVQPLYPGNTMIARYHTYPERYSSVSVNILLYGLWASGYMFHKPCRTR